MQESKLLNELQESDFDEHAVWQCWYGNDGKLVAGPTGKSETTYDHDSESPACDLVRAQFSLAVGATFPGFCMPHEYLSPEYYQPTIITKRGHVGLYQDEGWSEDEKARALTLLGYSKHEVFPIRFITEVKFDGALVRGLIRDFDQCVDDR